MNKKSYDNKECGNLLEDFTHLFCCMKYDWVFGRILDTQSNIKMEVIWYE